MNQKKPINHNLMQMIVSVVAFIINLILLIYIAKTNNIPQSGIITIAGFCIGLSFLLPVIIKAYYYSGKFTVKGFSASYAINEYHLNGYIRGKYLFLDAILNRVNGDFASAMECYEKCLKKATDKRLRLACYLDIARNMPQYLDILPVLLEGYEEFPDERDIFQKLASYYMWFEGADREEGTEWFRRVAQNSISPENRSKAYYYLGMRDYLNLDFEKAKKLFLKSIELTDTPPAYLLLDTAVCFACLGDYETAREYAVGAAGIVDDKNDIEFIKEKMDYIFKAKTEAVNPETEKLMQELSRREKAAMEDTVKIEDIRQETL
ncbi:MAG: tetratricopeptide repeat protein [Ruminiclostridium sp.]